MILRSPVKGRTILELGVEGKHATTPEEEKRGNVAIYLTLLMLLQHGRRDLMPLGWAWAKANFEAGRLPNPEDYGMDWAADFCTRVGDTLIDNAFDHLIGGESVAATMSRMSHIARTDRKWGKDRGGSAMEYLARALGLPDSFYREMAVVVRTGCAADCMADAACEAYKAKISGDDTKAKVVSAVALSTISALEPSFNHYPEAVISAFGKMTNPSMAEVWWRLHYELFKGGKITMPEPSVFDSPIARRDALWCRGSIDGSIAELRDTVCHKSWADFVRGLYCNLSSTMEEDKFMDALGHVRDSGMKALLEGKYAILTFQNDSEMAMFREAGCYQTGYDIPPTTPGFFDYSDDPLFGKRVNDKRLWGEEGRNITPAFLIHLDDTGTIQRARANYGRHVIKWPISVLDYATICINDHESVPYTLPATHTVMTKAIMAVHTTHLFAMSALTGNGPTPGNVHLVKAINQAIMGQPRWSSVLDIQIHRKMPLTEGTILNYD